VTDPADDDVLLRWRLVLGEAAEQQLGAPSGEWLEVDQALDWLYGRDEEEAKTQDDGGRRGGSGPSQLTVPEWVNLVHQLFPQSTIERLERDAIERYGITEVVTSPDALDNVEPNPTLLRAILQTKHLMNPEVLAMARKLVRKVVEQLLEALATKVQRAWSGAPQRHIRSPLRYSRNFDAKRTIRDNLRHLDRRTGKLVVRRPFFYARHRHSRTKWQLILVVDQSGSMLNSTIHAAVTAACFWNLPSVRTHLIAFDTEVVDLTDDVSDPVELLMGVQLGGGTYIDKAMAYAAELVDNPRRAIVVLITDFYEGGDANRLLRINRSLCNQGTRVLGLAALDDQAVPDYDRDLAGRMAQDGAHVGAMTPDQLAGFLAEVMR
jgi:hypothetical protein